MKTVDLELRPVFHWTAPRVRAHVLLCMLAYYLEWHMRQRLAPILFDEHDPLARDAQRTSPVAKAKPSPAACSKAASKRTDPADGEPLPVHSFRTLLADLATLTRNAVRLGKAGLHIDSRRPNKRAAQGPRSARCNTRRVDSQPQRDPSYIKVLRPKSGKVRANPGSDSEAGAGLFRFGSIVPLVSLTLAYHGAFLPTVRHACRGGL